MRRRVASNLDARMPPPTNDCRHKSRNTASSNLKPLSVVPEVQQLFDRKFSIRSTLADVPRSPSRMPRSSCQRSRNRRASVSCLRVCANPMCMFNDWYCFVNCGICFDNARGGGRAA